MPESSHRHTILLFLALGVALLLCICLLWNLAGAAHAAGTARQGETATQMALSQTTDGNNAPAAQPTENPRKSPPPGHFSLTLPPGYTPLLPYPLLFEYSLGKSELAESKSPHAIVACFNAQADTPLDAWRNERKAMDALKELHAQYTIDEQRIYLLAANVEGLAFAARHAADFNALYLEFTKDITPEEWQDLPLGNLANLAVFLDSSNLDVPPVNVRLLAKALQQNQVSRVPAPEFPLPMKDGVLPWALAELSLYLSNNQDVIQHSANRLANGACRWLRIEEFEDYDAPGEFTARILTPPSPAIAKLTVTTRNLNAVAIRRNWRDFQNTRTFFLEIDGQTLTLPNPHNAPEWLVLRKVGDAWQANAPAPEPPRKTADSEGPLAAIFDEPFVIVWGSQDPDIAEKWRQSAQEFADKCQAVTGMEIQCLQDEECTSEGLAGKRLVLMGSPRENLLVNNLLDDDPDFLRQIYQQDPRSAEQLDAAEESPLCCMTLYPADFYNGNSIAMILLADAPELIPEAWKPLFTPDALTADYLLFAPGEDAPRARGVCTPDWKIGE